VAAFKEVKPMVVLTKFWFLLSKISVYSLRLLNAETRDFSVDVLQEAAKQTIRTLTILKASLE
jgi:hypothetical protein